MVRERDRRVMQDEATVEKHRETISKSTSHGNSQVSKGKEMLLTTHSCGHPHS